MNFPLPKVKLALMIAVAMITVSGIGGTMYKARQQSRRHFKEQPRVTSLPPVFSKIKELEVVKVSILNAQTASPSAEVEIRNKSNKDIVAIDLVCGDGAVTRNGLHDDEHPIVVLKAHDTTLIEMNFSEMTFGAPLVVSAVTYADGSEEGDEKSLRAMHLARQRDRAIKHKHQLEEQKGVPTP